MRVSHVIWYKITFQDSIFFYGILPINPNIDS